MSGSDESVFALASSKKLLTAIVGKQHVNLTNDPALEKVVRSKLNVIVGINGRDIEKLKPAIDKLYFEMFRGTWNEEDAARKTTEANKVKRAEGKARRAKAKAEAEAKVEAEAKAEAKAEANE